MADSIFVALSFTRMASVFLVISKFVFLHNSLGALGSWGAALLAPYSDKPETSGIMRSTPNALATLVQHFWKDGWQVVR